jgi:D-alanyl-D-alanine carboxypeptidase
LRVPPASLTKILTALIAVTYLPADAGVPGTRQSWNAYPNTVGIEKGVSWPLKEVLHALLVYSANDAAYAIAQRVGGSLSAFGPVMDRSALQIGMSDDPVFHDPAGLDGPEGVDGGNLVSARDLAIAGRDLLHVPLLAAMVREESYDFVDPTGAPHDLPSMNFQFLDSYPGAIGIKTGFTDRAGDCIMAAATRHGRTMLAVVMNGYNPTETAIDLLNQGFATPAAAEPSGDHLPALALPSPPAPTRTMGGPVARPTKDARSIGRGPAASSGTKPAAAGARQGVATPRSSLRRPSATTARPATGPPNRSGLAAVVESWPAQALLVLAGLAALLALWELVSTNRVHRARQVKAGSNQAANTSVFATSRKRREQLIASYRRHERPAGFGRR